MADQVTVKIGADFSGLASGMDKAVKQITGFGDTVKGIFAGFLGAEVASRAFDGITNAIGGAIQSLAEVDKISGQTAAVIKSTGGAAGVAADEVAGLADALERKTGIEAESIQKGQNLLLTFTNIKNAAGANNDIFNQATSIMADLGTAMGGDASGAAIQLGKALNDPTQGITALTRVGVTFTDAQKDQIKALQASGDIMGAQKIILAELRKEFGGSAEAAGKTFGGALDRAKNAIDSISEAIIGSNVPFLTKALIKVSDAAYAISDAITNGQLIQLFDKAFGPGPRALVVALATVMAARLIPNLIGIAMTADAMMTRYLRAISAMVVANAPLIASVAAIAFAAYPFIKNWDTVAAMFSYVWQSMINAVNSAWSTITSASKNAFQIISGNFRAAYANAMAFFIGPLSRSFNALFESLPGPIRKALGGLKFEMPRFDFSGAGAAFESLKASANVALNYVSGWGKWTKDNFVATWGDLLADIRKIMGSFNGVMSTSSDGAQKSLSKIADSGTAMGEKVKSAKEKATKAVKEHHAVVASLGAGYLTAARDMTNFLLKAGEIKRVLDTQVTWKRINADIDEYNKRQNEANKIVQDAITKIQNIDAAAKYWGDTTDKTTEKQKLLRDAIDELREKGLDPQGERMDVLRKRYDELQEGSQKAADATGNLSNKLKDAKDSTPTFDDLNRQVGTLGSNLNSAFSGTVDVLKNFGVSVDTSMANGIMAALAFVGAISGIVAAVSAASSTFAALGAAAAVALGPVGLVIGGIALAIGAVAAGWHAWTKGAEEQSKKLAKEMEALNKLQDEYADAVESSGKDIVNAVASAQIQYEKKGQAISRTTQEERDGIMQTVDRYEELGKKMLSIGALSKEEQGKLRQEFDATAREIRDKLPGAYTDALAAGDTAWAEAFGRWTELAGERSKRIAESLESGLFDGLMGAMKSAAKDFLGGGVEWINTLRSGIKDAVANAIIEGIMKATILDVIKPQIEAISKKLAGGAKGADVIGDIRAIFEQTGAMEKELSDTFSAVRDELKASTPPKILTGGEKEKFDIAKNIFSNAYMNKDAEQMALARAQMEEAWFKGTGTYLDNQPPSITINYNGTAKMTIEELRSLTDQMAKHLGIRSPEKLRTKLA